MVPCRFTGEITHTVISYVCTVLVSVVKGGEGGSPMINMGLLSCVTVAFGITMK